MNVESKNKEAPASSNNEGGGAVPSGFILKLFQMVNGAPDEVISWTPAGDAFIIGSDLNRLESETLPQYFRHNRFQSLVRQLNFYSFRKINRERNVWIYKHKLFHRDRPEDLHQVRRRTCPGVDGRKQRFSRFSAQKISKYDEDKANQSSDDSSIEDTSGDEGESASGSKKRRGSVSSSSPQTKRSRQLWLTGDSEKPIKVDTSILPETLSSPTSVFDTHKTQAKEIDFEDDASANKKSDRMEMIERSMIVSEVAMKLEEHAKKAMKGRGYSRSRRAGVVTPPYGSSQSFSISARGLITYDDEYENNESNSGVITDGDDSLNSGDVSFTDENKPCQDFVEAPINCEDKVQEIVEQIRKRATYNFYNSEMINACAGVAGLLMTTAPGEDVIIFASKILELLASSDRLAADFYSYRSALHPESCVEPVLVHGRLQHEQAVDLRRALDSSSSRLDAVREFKIFSVNLIYKLVGRNGSFDIQDPFSHSDCKNLLRTADAWSKSVGRVA